MCLHSMQLYGDNVQVFMGGHKSPALGNNM